jgi:hypothetical protein
MRLCAFNKFEEKKMTEKILTIGLAAVDFEAIKEKAKKWGLSLSAYVRERIGAGDDASTALLSDFIDRVAKYPLGKTFPLRALYTDEEWEVLRPRKAHFGRRVNTLVSAGILAGLEIKGTDEYKTTTYSRIGKVELKADDTLDISKAENVEITPKTEAEELRDSFLELCGKIFDITVSLCKITPV